MPYHVDLFVSADQDPYHTAKVHTGLCALAGQGTIRLHYQTRTADALWTSDSLVLAAKVRRRPGDAGCMFCIDLRDRSDLFSMELLHRCQVYFKRGYYEPDVGQLPASTREKVLPFGLNYACRSLASTTQFLRIWALDRLGRVSFSPGRAIHEFASSIRAVRQYLACPGVAAYELRPESVVEPTILFQTRVWEAGDTAPDCAEEVNEQRAGLVRALRRAFGDRFRGGLLPTRLALERYPDAVSREPCRRRRYLEMSKRSLVAVYSRGLHHSNAFKLAEYLAASKCIVAEAPSHEVPRPLVAGAHFLSYQTPAECVDACAELLTDRHRAKQMRHENYRYYVEEVEPATHVRNCLDRALAARSASSLHTADSLK